MIKKRILTLLILSSLLFVSACGKGDSNGTSGDAGSSGMTAAEYEKQLGNKFDAPEGIENVNYEIIDGETPVGKVSFSDGKADFILKMQIAERGDLDFVDADCEWEYSYNVPYREGNFYIAKGYEDDKAVDVAEWMYNLASDRWIYTLYVVSDNKDGYDVLPMSEAICDIHWDEYNEAIDNFSGMDQEQLPDGKYDVSPIDISDITVENGEIRIVIDELYDYEGKVKDSPLNVGGQHFIPNICISGNVEEINFGENSSLDEELSYIEPYMDHLSDFAPCVRIEMKNGKLVKLITLSE